MPHGFCDPPGGGAIGGPGGRGGRGALPPAHPCPPPPGGPGGGHDDRMRGPMTRATPAAMLGLLLAAAPAPGQPPAEKAAVRQAAVKALDALAAIRQEGKSGGYYGGWA